MALHISELTPGSLSHLKPKIAFFDIDGTLVDSQHQIADHVVASINKLKGSGVLAGISSGRASFAAAPLIEKLGINGSCCFYSGALVIDPITKEKIFSEPFDQDLAVKFIELAEQEDFALELYTENSYYVAKDHKLHQRHSAYIGSNAEITDLRSLSKKENILKAVIVSSIEEEAKVMAALNSIEGICVGIAPGMADPDISFANMTSIKASREEAFKAIIDHLDIDSLETISFGDAQADIPFLKLAGAGIAMENASDEVKQAADYICGHVDEGGVSGFVELLLDK